MILSTHAIIGAAVARLLPGHPILGFIAAFISHFLADAIPHWEYELKSYTDDKNSPLKSHLSGGIKLVRDFAATGFDFAVGIFISWLFFVGSFDISAASAHPEILIGAAGGVLPDFFQFLYWKLRWWPLKQLQRFHLWIHAKKKLTDQPYLGIPLQIAFVVTVIFLSRSLI